MTEHALMILLKQQLKELQQTQQHDGVRLRCLACDHEKLLSIVHRLPVMISLMSTAPDPSAHLNAYGAHQMGYQDLPTDALGFRYVMRYFHDKDVAVKCQAVEELASAAHQIVGLCYRGQAADRFFQSFSGYAQRWNTQLLVVSWPTVAPLAGHHLPMVLTARETEVLHLIPRGLNHRQIGDQLHISSHTVSQHVRSLLRKYQARNAAQLVSLYYQQQPTVLPTKAALPEPYRSAPAQTEIQPPPVQSPGVARITD